MNQNNFQCFWWIFLYSLLRPFFFLAVESWQKNPMNNSDDSSQLLFFARETNNVYYYYYSRRYKLLFCRWWTLQIIKGKSISFFSTFSAEKRAKSCYKTGSNWRNGALKSCFSKKTEKTLFGQQVRVCSSSFKITRFLFSLKKASLSAYFLWLEKYLKQKFEIYYYYHILKLKYRYYIYIFTFWM